MPEIGDKRPANFTVPGAKRIVAATRWVEAQPRNGLASRAVGLQRNNQETLEVALVQDGGADGDSTTAPSYTYTAKDQDGDIVQDWDGNDLTEMEPTHNRPVGLTMVATQGTLYFLANGTIELRWTDEAPNFGPCAS